MLSVTIQAGPAEAIQPGPPGSWSVSQMEAVFGQLRSLLVFAGSSTLLASAGGAQAESRSFLSAESSREGGLLSMGAARVEGAAPMMPHLQFLLPLLGAGRAPLAQLIGAQLGEAARLRPCDPTWARAPGPLGQPGRESDLTRGSMPSRWCSGALRSQGGCGWKHAVLLPVGVGR